MSVLLIGDRDLVRLARFAADCLPLPPGLTAETLAARFRAANLDAWRDRYPDAPDPGLDLMPAAPEETTQATTDHDMLALLRTARDLRTNAVFEPGDFLSAVLSRVAEAAGKRRLEVMP